MSRADSRVHSPGTLTCARCPAARSALDAGPEAYDNPAEVWWGAFAASAVIRDLKTGAGRVFSGRAEPGRRTTVTPDLADPNCQLGNLCNPCLLYGLTCGAGCP